MKVRGTAYRSIWPIDQRAVGIIDQTRLPHAFETVRLTRALASQGVPVVAITDSSFSAIVEHAAHWFEIAEDDFAGFRSLSASMAFCMALTVAVAGARKDNME